MKFITIEFWKRFVPRIGMQYLVVLERLEGEKVVASTYAYYGPGGSKNIPEAFYHLNQMLNYVEPSVPLPSGTWVLIHSEKTVAGLVAVAALAEWNEDFMKADLVSSEPSEFNL